MSNSRLKNKGLSQEDLFNFSELFKLMKPRVMSLVIFTCAVGLLTSPSLVSTKDAIIGILLVSLGAGAAGALNMWYESDLPPSRCHRCKPAQFHWRSPAWLGPGFIGRKVRKLNDVHASTQRCAVDEAAGWDSALGALLSGCRDITSVLKPSPLQAHNVRIWLLIPPVMNNIFI